VVSVPRSHELQVAFALMIGGITFGAYSRNVRLKRIVAPIIITLFSFIFLESIRRNIDPPTPVLYGLAAMLAWNGAAALRRVRFCTSCGRTLEDGSKRKFCKKCRKSSSSPA
jgi:hypothetical protein